MGQFAARFRPHLGTLLTLVSTITLHGQVVLSPAARVTPDTGKPGFLWRIFANREETTDTVRRAEDALAGKLTDTLGNPLPNFADPLALGPSPSAGTPSSGNNPSLTFIIPTVINTAQTAGGREGNFPTDDAMPGMPATDGSTDGVAVEITTYLELPEGETTMGISSDDGFRTYGGIPDDVLQWWILGEFDGGRGAHDTLFTVKVTQPGVYPFRTIYEQGTQDASIEWFTVRTNGTKVLVNDVANGGIKAYRAITTGTYPYPRITSVKPAPGLRQSNQPESALEFEITDGAVVPFDESRLLSPKEYLSTFTKTRVGNKVIVRSEPTRFFSPMETFTQTVNFTSTNGYTRSETWSFRNLKNLILGTPVATETFDTVEEGTQPTGWTASNFTANCPGNSTIANDESAYYLNWVVISTNTMERIDGADVRAVNSREKLNGSPLTLEALRSGHVLYAESDGRCEGTQRRMVLANRGGVHGQTQFITSKAFNLSTATNVVLTFGCGFKQNEDSLGGVEYSVDGGSSWLPVVYYLDESRILSKSDGTVDGVATLNAIQDDTSLWIVSGAVKGERFGDALLATINDSIGQYIAPRRNDDGEDGKRIEAFRLPAASKKSDVRLRFIATGTDSWYFFVDNIALHDIPSSRLSTIPVSEFTATATPTNIVLNWKGGTGTFTIQRLTSLDGTWADLLSTTNRTFSFQSSTPTSFFRLLDEAGVP